MMQSAFSVARHALWTGVALMLLVPAVPAAAQAAVGVRAGVSVDPEQFYFGAHAQTPPLVDRVHFRPNVEIGIGDETTITAFNIEFAYVFPSSRNWNIYAGAGPALNLVHRGDDTDPEPGFNVLAGIMHERGLFAEIKLGALDSPRLKLGVGYAFRWR